MSPLYTCGEYKVEFSLSTVRTVIDDLKVKDICETKVKLLEAITEWSIMRGVSFMQVKKNKTNTQQFVLPG